VQERIGRIPRDGGSRLSLSAAEQLPCHLASTGFKDVYGRMSWEDVAPTITGGCVNPSKGRFLHPEEDRAITLREAAILQGFPATYTFSLGRGKFAAAELIGNALPPAMAEAQAKQLQQCRKRRGWGAGYEH
jgi:DNA (cytosine-5)-methyltransferase 1